MKIVLIANYNYNHIPTYIVVINYCFYLGDLCLPYIISN